MIRVFRPAVLAAALLVGAAAAPAPAQVVISQVYGGAGGAGALFQGDYVELFNRGTEPVDITNWSLQYAAGAGNFGFAGLQIPIAPTAAQPGPFIIQPNHYFLVRTYTPGPSTIGGAPLSADYTAESPVAGSNNIGVNLSATSGKIALVNSTNLLFGVACPDLSDPSIIDFLGYGNNTNGCAEGAAPAPPISITLAAFRANGGCQDTNNNAADFASATPAPRNASSPTRSCAVTNPSGAGSASPVPACPGLAVTLTFFATPGDNPPSTGIAVTGDFTALGGGPGNPFADQGNGVFTASTVISPAVNTPRTFSVPIAITDAQGRLGAGNIAVEVVDCSLRGVAAASPPGLCTGEAAVLTVAVTPGLQPASTGIAVSVDLSALSGPAAATLRDDGQGPDAVAGDSIFSAAFTMPPGVAPGVADLPVTITDAQARTASASIRLSHGECPDSAAPVVISQVYGGGGGSGATLRQDFIELFNRTDQPIDLSGWSIQYATTTGSFTLANTFSLFGTISANGYYLIGGFFGAGGTQDLPTIDDFVSLSLNQFNGKVALVRDASPILADCADPDLVDLVAYGPVTGCIEGVGPAPELSNPLAAIRKDGGCRDSNNNALDFVAAAPTPRNSESDPRLCAAAPSCPPDFNGDGTLDPDDLADYIACYFTSPPCPQADVNADGTADPDDLADYIAAYFAGC